MQYNFTKNSLDKTAAQVLFVACFDRETTPPQIAALQKNDGGQALDVALNGWITKTMKAREFFGREGDCLVLPTYGAIKANYVVVLGAGSKKNVTLDLLRRLGSRVTQIANDLKATSAAWVLEKSPAHFQAMLEGMELAAYHFDRFKLPEDRQKRTLREIFISTSVNSGTLQPLVAKTLATVAGVHFTRDLVNLPSNALTPTALAQAAKKIAQENKLRCQILTPEQIKKEKMGALLCVAQGSKEPPVFIHLTYKPKKKTKTTVALVGKGITFDSGGINLKTREMELMKFDMAGAATVLGVFSILSKLKVDVQVEGYIAAAENMPSGTAIKPGDIIRARSGKTIEIINTDAEGRLVLADALDYACERKPTYAIDMATLTGGVAIALGEKITGIMGNDQPLIEKILSAGLRAGEPIWQLPLFEDYKKGYKKGPADMKNAGSGSKASAIVGGLFLEEFVAPGTKWAHMDIASTVWADEPQAYISRWATGIPVRTILEFLQRI